MDQHESSLPRVLDRTPWTQRRWAEGQQSTLRFLVHVALALVALSATLVNRMDNDARAKGLIPVQVEPIVPFGQGHPCMQPDDEAPPPPQEEPPCPRSRR